MQLGAGSVGDFHGLRRGANLQLHVDGQRQPHGDRLVADPGLRKTFLRDTHVVGSRRNLREHISSYIICLCGSCTARADIGERHGGAYNEFVLWVDNLTRDNAG